MPMPTKVVSAREGGRHHLPGRVGGGGGGKLPFVGYGRLGRLPVGRDVAGARHQHFGKDSAEEEAAAAGGDGGAQWASLPMELLVEVIRRVEDRESSWPGRREVVTCAAVCRSWREATSEVVRSVENSGLITFPVSLKQPGPRDSPIQCFIRRERATSTYYLYMGLSPVLLTDSGKFLLAARRMRRATSTDFVISLASDDFSRAGTMYIGKLRTNFLGTKFTIYDNQPPSDVAATSSSRSSNKRRIHSKQVSPRVSAGNYRVATISYEINVLRSRGPRRMQCTMHTVPFSAARRGSASSSSSSSSTPSFSALSLQESSSPSPVQTPTNTSAKGNAASPTSSSCYRNPGGGFRSPSSVITAATASGFQPLVLKNKAPRWHEQLQCWCLNFRGRVTVASVKNFQLVAAPPAMDPPHAAGSPAAAAAAADEERVMLQFGKIGKDIFTMDYLHPLSAFQAFAICLSSFDTKPVCE